MTVEIYGDTIADRPPYSSQNMRSGRNGQRSFQNHFHTGVNMKINFDTKLTNLLGEELKDGEK